MKKIFLFLFVATFVLFTSCEKDVIEDPPYSLAFDLENGYWSDVEDLDYIVYVLKFDGTNVTQYSICEEVCPPYFSCILLEEVFPYTLEGDVLFIGVAPSTIKIEGDILTMEPEDWQPTIFERKETFDYSDCE